MLIGKPDKRMFLVSLCTLAGGLSLGSTPALAVCPNEELRTGLSTSLPDCRAYEMVSPPDKNGHSVQGGASFLQFGQAAAGGGAVSYQANGAFPGAVTGALGNYISARGPGGWSTFSPLPAQAYSYSIGALEVHMALYSADLSRAVLEDPADSPALVAGEQETGGVAKASNLFLRDNATGTYSLINFPAPGLTPAPYRLTFDGASADLGTVIFNAPAALTPEAPGSSGGGVDNLYSWRGGVLSLVSQIPPPGQASCGPAGPAACVAAPHGARFGDENANSVTELQPSGNSIIGAISSDGSRVFFTAEGDLYVRENGESTVHVDASQAAGPGGGGIWATAAGDGSRVFFFDDASARLTTDTLPGSGRNLYSYDTSTGALTDLTPGPNPGVVGVANQASEDGAYLYFLANGVLTTTPNNLEQSASPGDCALNPVDQKSCNLYLIHDGAISFIHTVSGKAATRIYGSGSNMLLQEHSASRVSPDGRHLVFFAEAGVGGADEPVFRELFEYSADSGQLNHLCACNGSEFNAKTLVLVSMPQALYAFRYPRNVSDDGTRVFFESLAPLLPQDTNGRPDVYQWEALGRGTCGQSGGCLSLVSSGTSTEGSWFLDASASGDDVFFATLQQLAFTDIDGAFDLYDARVEGGFPSPPKPPECFGDACLNVPAAPIDATPASLTFSGAGNLHGTPPSAAVKPPPATNALVKAVKACAKQRKSQRKRCEARVHRRYAKKTARSIGARRASVNRKPGT